MDTTTSRPAPLSEPIACTICGRPHRHPSGVCPRHSRGSQEPSARAQTAAARKALAKVRTIRRNQRLGRYQGRNSASTESLVARELAKAHRATEQLPRQLGSAIWNEHGLATRISLGQDNGQRRPELRERLTAARRVIRAGGAR